jgi:hypothetical protein
MFTLDLTLATLNPATHPRKQKHLPRQVIFYDMGSGSTEVALVKYSTYRWVGAAGCSGVAATLQLGGAAAREGMGPHLPARGCEPEACRRWRASQQPDIAGAVSARR